MDTTADDALDSRRAWRVVAGAGIVAAFGVQTLWGSTIGLFLRPMEAELGWTRADIGFVTALTAAASFVVVPIAGWVIDRVPLRPLVIGGGVAQGLCVGAGAFLAGSVWNFYAQVFAIMILGMAASLLTLSKITRGWFDRSLGRALGVLFAVASLGGIVNPLLAQGLIDRVGWRGACLCLGAVSLVVTAGIALLLVREGPGRGRPGTIGRSGSSGPMRELFGKRAWWVLTGWSVLFGYAVSGIGFHLAALLQDRGGDPGQSALAVSLGAAGGLVGNLASGWVTDRFSARLMASLVMAVPMLGVLGLLNSQTALAGIAAAVVLGLSTGTEHSVVAVLCGRYFDAPMYGRAYSSQMVAASAGSGLAPWLVGLMQERAGNYTLALMVAAGAYGTAAALAWLMPRLASTSTTAPMTAHSVTAPT